MLQRSLPRCSRRRRERRSSWGGGSGKAGHSVDDVGQGGPGLGGREALQGRERPVSVEAAEVDGRCHTFAGLDCSLQLSGNTGTTGWVSAGLACTIICESTGRPLPLPEVKVRTKASKALKHSQLLCSGSPLHHNHG